MRRNAVKECFRGLLLVLVLCAAGCGGGDTGTVAPANAQVGGAWDVAADYGNGLVVRQTWMIVQTGSDLAMTGNPPDASGPLLDNVAATGYVFDNSISASWVKTAGPCRFSSRLEATVSDNALSGIIYWIKNPYGAGSCSSGSGTVTIAGGR